ncbi:MAG: phosphatase PAP2 family protein [Burkholderiaceae bacterium]|nr:phosphatase PAP2 family protein [Burkholderiaceae bacterium]
MLASRYALAPILAISTEAIAMETGSGQTAGPGRFEVLREAVYRVPGELTSLATYPWRASDDFLKASLGIGALILLDKPLTRAYQRHIEEPLSGFRVSDAPGPFKTVGTGGTDGWLLLGVSGTYLGGLATGDVRAQRAGLAAAKSITYSVLISQVLLKTAFGRKRPTQPLGEAQPDRTYTDNPLDFGNRRESYFSSHQYASSFPSFHVTAWFAAAKVYEQAYGNAWLPYGLLTVGLASDIKGHRHWVSDMVAGALLGTLIGSAVSQGYFDSDDRPGWRVDAGVSGEGTQIRLNYTF